MSPPWLVAAALLAAQPQGSPAEGARAGCANALAVEIDRDSFASQGTTSPPPTSDAQLEAYRRIAGDRFKAAANGLCAAGRLPSEAFVRFRRLLVQRGDGAAEAAVYVEPELSGADTLVLQQYFMDGIVPEPDDIAQGILCWHRPDTPVCAERQP